MPEGNWWYLVGLVVAGAVTYTVNRFGKNADHRREAEAAQYNIAPPIIKEQNERIDRQNKRIDQLSSDITTLWKIERECREELAKSANEMGNAERRNRHFVSALLQNIVILRRMLRQAGAQLPPMVSLERFEEEGGTLREEWIRAIQDE